MCTPIRILIDHLDEWSDLGEFSINLEPPYSEYWNSAENDFYRFEEGLLDGPEGDFVSSLNHYIEMSQANAKTWAEGGDDDSPYGRSMTREIANVYKKCSTTLMSNVIHFDVFETGEGTDAAEETINDIFNRTKFKSLEQAKCSELEVAYVVKNCSITCN